MNVTFYINGDKPACSVVRYSDGGDALEWFHDISLRRAIQVAAETINLHLQCDVEIAICDQGRVVQTFSDAAH